MKELLLIDGNNLAMRLFLSNAVQTSPGILIRNYDLWKYLMFTNIVGNANAHTKQIVFAIDGDNGSWRKIAFHPYKANRTAKREADDFDWSEFFEVYKKLMDDMASYLPIKVIKINRIEGDDIIGAIALNENGYDQIRILSADSDMKQLIRTNIHVYDPMKGEYMSIDNVENWLVEQCLLGQKKDNIYNILTPDNWGDTGDTVNKRKPGFGPVAAEKVMSGDVFAWLKEKGLEKHYSRNRLLIDLSKIPQAIVDMILTDYAVPCSDYDPSKVNFFLEELNEWPSFKYNSEDAQKAHAVLANLN